MIFSRLSVSSYRESVFVTSNMCVTFREHGDQCDQRNAAREGGGLKKRERERGARGIEGKRKREKAKKSERNRKKQRERDRDEESNK